MANQFLKGNMSGSMMNQEGFFNFGQQLKENDQALSKKQQFFTPRQYEECLASPGSNYEDCSQMMSVLESFYRLWIAIQMQVMALPAMTLFLYCIALVCFIVWLRPLSLVYKLCFSKSTVK